MPSIFVILSSKKEVAGVITLLNPFIKGKDSSPSIPSSGNEAAEPATAGEWVVGVCRRMCYYKYFGDESGCVDDQNCMLNRVALVFGSETTC
jgi:hypothetical protein